MFTEGDTVFFTYNDEVVEAEIRYLSRMFAPHAMYMVRLLSNGERMYVNQNDMELVKKAVA
jgi:hypothetical protein